jgi:hypothetical protein
MKVIPETGHVHYIWNLRYYVNHVYSIYNLDGRFWRDSNMDNITIVLVLYSFIYLFVVDIKTARVVVLCNQFLSLTTGVESSNFDQSEVYNIMW